MTPNAKYQAKYRARYVKRGEALNRIIERLTGNEKPLAAQIRQIAIEGME